MSIWKVLKQKIFNRAEALGQKARLIKLPFFDGEPLYDVAAFFWKGIVDGAITTRASAIAFNFILAIFPAIIFVFTLIPYIPIDNFQQQLLNLLQSILPQAAFTAIQGTIEDIVTQPRGGLLSFGFLAAFIFATNGIVSVIAAFNGTIHAIETRSWINQRLVALILAIILTLLTTISVALITVSQSVMNFLVENGFLQIDLTYYLLLGGKWLVICALFFFGYAFLFYLAPARKTKFRFISAGGTLATILSIITTIGFSYYINNFGKYNTLYGSIGTLVVVMLVFYFNSLILLIGFELNVSIWHSRQTNSDTVFD
ncbi:MAG: YihY/virulence factor BrkB family protein [Bacteroidia bacterium]|nr:YihY/virulence factor BrkB family protein [Bacteroidia bacterium]